MALLDERDWGSRYELTFGLWLESAECEFLTGHFDRAEQLLVELLPRGASKVDEAAVYHLKVQLHCMKSENQQAVATGLTCLRRLGIDMPEQPTQEQVQAEYEAVWHTLNGRQIETLIDLPPMTDPELQAGMRMLSVLFIPSYFSGFRLWCLQVCRTVQISVQHGTSGPSSQGYVYFGLILGWYFHRYDEGYRFAKLARDLVEKHGLIASRAKVYSSLASVAMWTQPIATAVDFWRTSIRAAIETGDPTFACLGMVASITQFLLRNDPLDLVWRESEMALDFIRKAKFSDAADIIVSQQRFIATMRGQTVTFSTFSGVQFDEATFEARFTAGRMPMMICGYWNLKLKTRFLSGDYAEALAAADKAKQFLWASPGQIQQLYYFYYTALTVSALYETASADKQQAWCELLTAHREQLREWAENYPPTFADKHILVLAEIARVEKRDADALRLYEQAIHAAREQGFVQYEGIAHELAAQYCLAHGLETAGYAHLRSARNCYDRWGAHGKVKQLDERYPRLREERAHTSSATTGQPVGQLDIETIVKASQALSSEMVLAKLIEKLMRIALEHAAAERGLLILIRGDQAQIEAEATTALGATEVTIKQTAIMSSRLPESALHYVMRTRDSVVLDDALVRNLYSEDEYVRQRRPRSVLCLPIVKQTNLVGALYLENNLTPCAFTSNRIAVLKLLASQAAISLENAHLYSDLDQAQAYLLEGQRLSHSGSFGFTPSTGELIWSSETYRIFDYAPAIKPTLDMVLQRVHPEDGSRVQSLIDSASHAGKDWDLDHRLLMPDGSVKHLHVVAHAAKNESRAEVSFVGAVMDVTAAKHSQQALEQALHEIKTLKDRLQSENIVLREEIDRASMFEEIVGDSRILRNLLSRVTKVAPTDSTVLITGETGTGKELIARAIHKRSRRSSRAFVSVNCAAIPHDLIASELFGHEKGAFTGAVQRRLGRFELAEGGTIFLDEVGELPAETQVALLRVLQEHEFERLGGTGSIRTNVRVIAATNRDLEATIAAGTFRSDLFYRLNVFPIEVPSLRERREDIPLLVEYFIDRYARKAGKRFQAVSKKSLDLLQSYPWPGNIRELQNVIERSVIVCETENFSVDESWLSRKPRASAPKSQLELSQTLAAQEKEMIEAVLRESGGRVDGPSGAAARLGMPRSTLESKVKSLKIDKKRFKTSPRS
jgi:transcriptional regulator with GAF, ATPase, and Fis domain